MEPSFLSPFDLLRKGRVWVFAGAVIGLVLGVCFELFINVRGRNYPVAASVSEYLSIPVERRPNDLAGKYNRVLQSRFYLMRAVESIKEHGLGEYGQLEFSADDAHLELRDIDEAPTFALDFRLSNAVLSENFPDIAVALANLIIGISNKEILSHITEHVKLTDEAPPLASNAFPNRSFLSDVQAKLHAYEFSLKEQMTKLEARLAQQLPPDQKDDGLRGIYASSPANRVLVVDSKDAAKERAMSQHEDFKTRENRLVSLLGMLESENRIDKTEAVAIRDEISALSTDQHYLQTTIENEELLGSLLPYLQVNQGFQKIFQQSNLTPKAVRLINAKILLVATAIFGGLIGLFTFSLLFLARAAHQAPPKIETRHAHDS